MKNIKIEKEVYIVLKEYSNERDREIDKVASSFLAQYFREPFNPEEVNFVFVGSERIKVVDYVYSLLKDYSNQHNLKMIEVASQIIWCYLVKSVKK